MRGPADVLFVIDGAAVRIFSIADAARLVSQIVPRVDSQAELVDDLPEGPPALGETPLSFASGSAGARALVSGWGEPEEWGTWSIDRSSMMRLLLPEESRRVCLGLGYRTIPLANGHR